MRNFWQEIPRPIFVLAPMYGVTNVVFREMIALTAPADVYFTEFVSADTMNSVGYKNVKGMLAYTPQQRPIVAQIWGRHPGNLEKAAQKIAALGFDGIDLNMGCPQRDVLDYGVCAALINDHGRAHETIAATRAGAGGLPVSVKTRIGVERIQTEEWVGFLLAQEVAAITLHGRTAADMSAGAVRWDEIAKGVAMRNEAHSETLIIGNGDVANYAAGLARVAETGVEGVMIGRGLFYDIFAFEKVASPQAKRQVTPREKVLLLRQHLEMHHHHYQDSKRFEALKRLIKKMYVSDFPRASALRAQVMSAVNVTEAQRAVDHFLERDAPPAAHNF